MGIDTDSTSPESQPTEGKFLASKEIAYQQSYPDSCTLALGARSTRHHRKCDSTGGRVGSGTSCDREVQSQIQASGAPCADDELDDQQFAVADWRI